MNEAMATRVDVYYESAVAEGEADVRLMDATERARRSRMQRPLDRAMFTAGAALLRRAAGRQLGVPANEVVIERRCWKCSGPHGRPTIVGTGLKASVSHAHGLVAIALAMGVEVGIDIEHESSMTHAFEIARDVLNEDELVTVLSPRDALVYWTRKESAVKATGDGVTAPLNRVIVTPPFAPARLISYLDLDVCAQMADLELKSDYVASMTVLTEHRLDIQLNEVDIGHWSAQSEAGPVPPG